MKTLILVFALVVALISASETRLRAAKGYHGARRGPGGYGDYGDRRISYGRGYGRGGYGAGYDGGYGGRGVSSRTVVNKAYKADVVVKDYGVWSDYKRLTVETFETTVITDQEHVWVVAYINPDCPACKRLAV